MLAFSLQRRLRDFTFDVAGEVADGVTVVLGPSGAGKSTLLRLLAGLVRPDAGCIVLGGRTLFDERTDVPAHRRNIGMVFQEYALFPHLDVAANVAYGLRARGIARATRDERVARTLAMLEIAPLAHERVDELSGGQRQRVALARALVIEPDALFLDEPLSALDPQTRERVRVELAALLADIAIPTLLVTHDEADRAAFPDRTLRLDRGTVQGTPRSTTEEPA
jgi:putative spermidine/putrescine transport system ATP-binding protein